MDKIIFQIKRGTLMGARDSVIVSEGEDHAEALARGVAASISTDVQVELGEVTVHLAMLHDPDHWEEDWRERGVEDVYEFLAGLIESGSYVNGKWTASD